MKCGIVAVFCLYILISVIVIAKSPLFSSTAITPLSSTADGVVDVAGCSPCITILDSQSYAALFELTPTEKNVPMIDIVVTWAGPNHYDAHNKTEANRNLDPRSRDDNEELRYCLRAIHQHLPWFHRLFIVVNDGPFHEILANQTFINAAAPRLRVVNIRDLGLANNTNSNAIEPVLHRIPTLSEHYLYFNDDFFIGRPLHWSFFFGRNRQGELVPRMPYILYQAYTSNARHTGEQGVFSDTYQCMARLNGSIGVEEVPYANHEGRAGRYFDHMPRVYLKV